MEAIDTASQETQRRESTRNKRKLFYNRHHPRHPNHKIMENFRQSFDKSKFCFAEMKFQINQNHIIGNISFVV